MLVKVGEGDGEGKERIFGLCWKVQVSRDEAHDKEENLIIIRVLNWSEFIHNYSLLTLLL